MKRFYCVVCKKFKRVRVYPRNVVNVTSTEVVDRKGACKYHSYDQLMKAKVS